MKRILFLILIILASCEKPPIDSDEIIIDYNPKIELNVLQSNLSIPTSVIEYSLLRESIDWQHGNFYYVSGGNEYLLIPGAGTERKGNPILFKKQNNSWTFHKIYNDVEMEGVRQGYWINDSRFIIADAAECYSQSCLDEFGIVRDGSYLWVVDIVGDDLSFQKIPKDGYHHDVSFGDLDNDGDLDYVSTGAGIVYQTSNGFNIDSESLPPSWGNIFFAVEIVDLDGDGYSEIIQASYVDSEPLVHGFRVLKRNNNEQYDIVYESTETKHQTYNGMYGANWIRAKDINSDGLYDLLIQREGNGISENTMEIYFGKSDGTFTSKQLITNNGNIKWLTAELLDVDVDGDLDIVFGAHGGGSGLRLGSRYEDGFRLENLIYINDGFGNFERISNELVSTSSYTFNKFIPYMNKNNELTFWGGLVESYTASESSVYISEVIIKNL